MFRLDQLTLCCVSREIVYSIEKVLSGFCDCIDPFAHIRRISSSQQFSSARAQLIILLDVTLKSNRLMESFCYVNQTFLSRVDYKIPRP